MSRYVEDKIMSDVASVGYNTKYGLTHAIIAHNRIGKPIFIRSGRRLGQNLKYYD